MVKGVRNGKPFYGVFKATHLVDGICYYDQGNALRAIKGLYSDLVVQEMMLETFIQEHHVEVLEGELRELEREIERRLDMVLHIGGRVDYGPSYATIERKLSLLESYWSGATCSEGALEGMDRAAKIKARLRWLT